jgi:hypothetical protein
MTPRRRLLTCSLAQVGALGLLSIGAGLFVSGKVRPIVDEHLGLETEAILGLADRLEVPLASGETEEFAGALGPRAQDLGDALGAAIGLAIEGYQVGSVEVVFSKARERSLAALERSEVGRGTTSLLEIPLAGAPAANTESVRHAQ